MKYEVCTWIGFMVGTLAENLLCTQAVIVRPLSAVSSLVRFAEEPQMFAIEFNDGCPIHVRT